MRVIHLDIDNTLIYSYRHNIGSRKVNVEMYHGRELSYITEKTYELLLKIKEEYLVVPTTTRTKEQYDRIDMGVGGFDYALLCNGGVLLAHGEKDNAWYDDSRKLIADCTGELWHAIRYLEKEPLRKFEIRFVEELFVFTKCNDPVTVTVKLKKQLDQKKVDVFHNREKVYVIPKKMDKGTAVRRFREYIGADEVIAAGDSELDMPMVEAADIGIVPAGFCGRYMTNGNLREMKGEGVFSDELLSWIEAGKQGHQSIFS